MASNTVERTLVQERQSFPHHCCIVPPEMLRHITNSERASTKSKANAAKTLDDAMSLYQNRVGALAQTQESNDGGLPPVQSVVGPDVYRGILDSDQASAQAKESARRRLQEVSEVKTARETAVPSKPRAKHLYRELYSADGMNELPGIRLFTEGHEMDSNDRSSQEVYKHFKTTFDFYYEVFGRNSIDDHGYNLIGVVHYDKDNGFTKGYFNAFFNGKLMAFGDGDDEIFTSFTHAVDITAHELTHGVTANTARLPYEFQAGALNESISDVFASMVKQYSLDQTVEEADWLIGEGLFLVENAPALRNMAHPGTAHDNTGLIGRDRQGADMDDFRVLPNTDEGDHGGVHVNSGIPNRAFYLAATAIGGKSWEKTGKIWYAALTDPELKHVDVETAFRTFADLTCKHASQLPGEDGPKALAACRKAWTTVKVYRNIPGDSTPTGDDGSSEIS